MNCREKKRRERYRPASPATMTEGPPARHRGVFSGHLYGSTSGTTFTSVVNFSGGPLSPSGPGNVSSTKNAVHPVSGFGTLPRNTVPLGLIAVEDQARPIDSTRKSLAFEFVAC